MVYEKTMKRMLIVVALAGVLYATLLVLSIAIISKDTLIHHTLQPYIYGSRPLDLFFAFLVSAPFSWYLFYFKKDNYYQYISLRINVKTYIFQQVMASLTLCFIMVFLVNMTSICFSLAVANIDKATKVFSLENYIGGNLQMNNPLLFGVFWSLYKSALGALICLMGQGIALYSKNLFLTVLAPLVYVFLESFVTAILRVERYSFTTAFVLNRLSPQAMKVSNMAVAIAGFILVTAGIWIRLRKDYGSRY